MSGRYFEYWTLKLKESASLADPGVITFRHSALNPRDEFVAERLRVALVARRSE